MGLLDKISAAAGRAFARLARRAAGWLVAALFLLVALYQATVALHTYLEMQLGIVLAHLAIAGGYAAVALIVVLVLWFTQRGKPASASEDAAAPFAGLASLLAVPKEMRLALLLEALLLGYSLAPRSSKRKEDA